MSKPLNKEGFWKEHSSAWKESGLTQLAYCEAQGISYKNFVYQHHRISSKVPRAPINFVEAQTETLNTQSQTAALQLMLPNGVRVGITSEVDATLLEMVLRIAGGLTC